MYSYFGFHFRTLNWMLAPLRFLLKIRFVPENFSKDHFLEASKGADIVYVLPRFFFLDVFVLNAALKILGIKTVKVHARPNRFRGCAVLGIRARRQLFVKQNDRDLFSESVSQLLQQDHRVSRAQLLLWPVSVFWSRKAERNEQNFLMKALFHDDGNLHAFQKFLIALLQGGEVRIHFGKPMMLGPDLLKVDPALAEHDPLAKRYGFSSPTQTIARKIRRDLLIEFNRERTAVMGPNLYDFQNIANRILNGQEVQDYIHKHEKDKRKAEQKAVRFLDEIAANYNYSVVRAFEKVFDFVWTVIFRGVRVRNFENVATVARSGQILWMPCHRSHLDYMLLSYVLFKKGLVTPHVAAGQNLSFFPAGPILRRGGAFFLRRSFQGNRFYSLIFGQYVNFLMHNSFPVEFFHEGGRSRIGKLLSPKLGFTSICVSSIISRKAKNTYIIPVYFGYDKVMEDASYAKELMGAKKQKESLWVLLKSIRFLFGNYGFVDVSFGAPIHFGDAWTEYFNNPSLIALQGTTEISPNLDQCSERLDSRDIAVQGFIKNLARRVNTGINQNATACTTALIATLLCAHNHKLWDRDEVKMWLMRCVEVIETIRSQLGWSVAVSASTPSDAVLFHSSKPPQSGEDVDVVGTPIHQLASEENEGARRERHNHLANLILSDALQWQFLKAFKNEPDKYEKNMDKDINLWWYRGTLFHLIAIPGIVAQLVLQSGEDSLSLELLEKKFAAIRHLWEEELFWPASTSSSLLVRCALSILQKWSLVIYGTQDDIIRASSAEAVKSLEVVASWVGPEKEIYGIQIAAALQLIEGNTKLKRDDLISNSFVLHRNLYLKGKASVPPNLSKVFGARTFDALYRVGLYQPSEGQSLRLSYTELVGVSGFLDTKFWQTKS